MEIVLCTFNSRFSHTSFSLRYLAANLAELRSRAEILEFTIQALARESAEEILARQPRVIGFSVYIWNVELTTQVIRILKCLAPDVKIVVGGPEVSHEANEQEICHLADHVVQGEGEVVFLQLCRQVLGAAGDTLPKLIQAPLPELVQLKSPYTEYTDEDVAHRIVYVEASRGCPFECEYCLSSLDKKVRSFDQQWLLSEFEGLLKRGARQFKFIDRTFNLSARTCSAILEFFHPWTEGGKAVAQGRGVQLHFEMVPDRLPPAVKEWIERYPAGSLQFEIGIQTWDPEVATRVSRKQDYLKIVENLKYLGGQPAVHIHADLIAGLPGESLKGFAAGFDQLHFLGVEEIQVGVLKRLRGAPISRHSQTFKMVYQPFSPYTVLQTSVLSFAEVQSLVRFAKVWDLFGNSGKYRESFRGVLREFQQTGGSPFSWVFEFTQALEPVLDIRQGLSAQRQVELLARYLCGPGGLEWESIKARLESDLGHSITGEFLKKIQSQESAPEGGAGSTQTKAWSRQRAHQK